LANIKMTETPFCVQTSVMKGKEMVNKHIPNKIPLDRFWIDLQRQGECLELRIEIDKQNCMRLLN
jgi:hypothetical protein